MKFEIQHLFPELNWPEGDLIELVRKEAARSNSLTYVALFYTLEAINEGHDASAELKALLETDNVDKVEHVHILVMLSLEAIRNNRHDLVSEVNEKLLSLDIEDLPSVITKYIGSLSIPEKSVVALKGKEKLLYDALVESPKAKADLILMLYGDGDYFKAENRFKALISRLRKKIDQQVILSPDGLYELV